MSAQILAFDVAITLGAGASQVVTHGLIGPEPGNVALIPFHVVADRATPIVSSAATSTTVTFTNPTLVSQTANFRIWRYHSVNVPDATACLHWNGNSGSGSASNQQFVNEYFVDGTLAADASVRRYTTIAAAVAAWAAATVGVPTPLPLRISLRSQNSAYTWDGAGWTGATFNIDFGSYGDPDDTALDLTGATLNANAELSFRGLRLTMGGATTGGSLNLNLRDCEISGSLVASNATGSVNVDNSTWVQANIETAGDMNLNARNTQFTQAEADLLFFAGTLIIRMQDCVLTGVGFGMGGGNFIQASTAMDVRFVDCTFNLTSTTAALPIFAAPSGAIDVRDVRFSLKTSGAGTFDMGAGLVYSQPQAVAYVDTALLLNQPTGLFRAVAGALTAVP